jgi:hypothetical protein
MGNSSCNEQIDEFLELNWKRVSKRFIADSDSLYFDKIEQCLLGKTKSEIIEVFGKANYIDDNRIVYYINRKPSSKKLSRTVEFWFDGFGKMKRCYVLTILPVIY